MFITSVIKQHGSSIPAIEITKEAMMHGQHQGLDQPYSEDDYQDPRRRTGQSQQQSGQYPNPAPRNHTERGRPPNPTSVSRFLEI